MSSDDVIFVAFAICAVVSIGVTLYEWLATRKDRRGGSRQRV
jgi:hypothetical protein